MRTGTGLFNTEAEQAHRINGDVAFNLSGYSILDSFANEISSSTALYAKDSRVRFLKTKILGEVIKVGRSEISSM